MRLHIRLLYLVLENNTFKRISFIYCNRQTQTLAPLVIPIIFSYTKREKRKHLDIGTCNYNILIPSTHEAC